MHTIRKYIEILREAEAPMVEKQMVLDPERELSVFDNPSPSELRKLLDQFGELRGNASANGTFYVWDANTWTHHTIQKYLGHMPYYFYFSKTRNVQAEEWQKEMRRKGDIFVGAKFEADDRLRPDIALSQKMVQRAIGT